jgi:hypothetical protein
VVIVRSRARRPALIALIAVAAAAACAKEKPVPAVSAPDAAPSAAPTAASSAVPLDLVPLPPDTAGAELKQYRLSLPMLERWAKTQSALNAVTTAHPEVLLNLQRNAQIKTVDQMVAMFGKEPLLKQALSETQMSAHDYLLTMISMQTAWEGYARSAGGKPLPADLPPALVENIGFLRANMPAVQHILGTIKNNPPPRLPATLPAKKP